MVILKLSLDIVLVRIHLNTRLTHRFVDDYVLQVMDMEISNQYMDTCYECGF
jgi:hypothetical protein